MRFARLTLTSIALFGLTVTALAQDAPELPAESTFSDSAWTLTISHPEDWVSVGDDEFLILSSDEEALDILTTRDGSIKPDTTGIIFYAPATADSLDLPDDATAADALTALLEREGLQSPSGEVYDGDPAISFNVFPLQADGEIDFGIQLITNASVDALAFAREGTFVFALLVTDSDVFALTEAMWDTLTLTPAGAAPEATETLSDGVTDGAFALTVQDGDAEYTFSAMLPDGWEGLGEELTGNVYLASAGAIEVITIGSDSFERGEAAMLIVLPPALRALALDPLADPDAVLTAYAASLGIEAYPALVEGYDVPVATAYITTEALPTGEGVLYTFGFPDGAVVVLVMEINGSGNPGTSDVLRSLAYGPAES